MERNMHVESNLLKVSSNSVLAQPNKPQITSDADNQERLNQDTKNKCISKSRSRVKKCAEATVVQKAGTFSG